MVSSPEGSWARAPPPFPLSLLGLSPPSTSPLHTLSLSPSSSLCPPSPPFSLTLISDSPGAGRQLRRKDCQGIIETPRCPRAGIRKAPRAGHACLGSDPMTPFLKWRDPEEVFQASGMAGGKRWGAEKSRLGRKKVTHFDFRCSEF